MFNFYGKKEQQKFQAFGFWGNQKSKIYIYLEKYLIYKAKILQQFYKFRITKSLGKTEV